MASAGDQDITVGEVYRLLQGVQKDIREQSNKYVPIELYISERDGLRDDVKDLNTHLAEARTEINIERTARMKAEQERNREASSRRLQWTLVVISPLVAILANWFLTNIGLIHVVSP